MDYYALGKAFGYAITALFFIYFFPKGLHALNKWLEKRDKKKHLPRS